jgi:hypothetical protein
MAENVIAKVTTALQATGDHMERVMFPNGRGVSIVRHSYSYGGKQGLFEVGVLGLDGELDYSTPVTGDVLGWQTVAEVVLTMKAVADLPAAGSKADKLLKLQARRDELQAVITAKEQELQDLQRDYGDLNAEISGLGA